MLISIDCEVYFTVAGTGWEYSHGTPLRNAVSFLFCFIVALYTEFGGIHGDGKTLDMMRCDAMR